MRQYFTPERSVEIIRAALGPGCSRLDIDICSVRPWMMNALVADSYFSNLWQTVGRRRSADKGGVILVGDAAHQFPPAGGFGLNTGVQVSWLILLMASQTSLSCLANAWLTVRATDYGSSQVGIFIFSALELSEALPF